MAEQLVVLDSNIVMRQPLLVGLMRERSRFVIPRRALSEIGRAGQGFIVQLIASGRIKVLPEQDEDALNRIIDKYPKLSIVDAEVLQDAMQAAEARHRQVVLATDDLWLIRAAHDSGIETLSSSDIAKIVAGAPERDPDVERELRNERKAAIIRASGAIALGVLSNQIAARYHEIAQFIAQTSPVWGTLVLLLVTAVGLLVLRFRLRLGYAAIEIGVGLAIGFYAFQAYQSPTPDSTALLKAAAAVFAIVRGLTNLGRGLRGTNRQRWIHRFGDD